MFVFAVRPRYICPAKRIRISAFSCVNALPTKAVISSVNAIMTAFLGGFVADFLRFLRNVQLAHSEFYARSMQDDRLRYAGRS